MSEEVLLQRDFPVEGVATLTLNRPQRGNALTGEMLTRLLALLDELEQVFVCFLSRWFVLLFGL
jgi:enoyl-CoA hydratase/carnithine racemase